MNEELEALMSADDPPCHYGLTPEDVKAVASCFDWEGQWEEACWRGDVEYESLAEMIRANPAPYLSDISTYYDPANCRYYPLED